ncbi:hypothetical protein [Devosia sp. 2618]|uniref:hypothetical protein n=1 Tax=Devosia sp. 2618 TaxID=3156454 RepID=UPI003391E69F
MRKTSFLAVALLMATPAMAIEPPPETLIGNWEVTGVTVDDTPVAALVTDDPSFMGAVLSIAADKIEWTKGTDERPIDPTIDNCDQAANFALTDGNYIVTCGDGGWGPGDGATIRPIDENDISLIWYDGGTLTLTRVETVKPKG